MKVNDSSDGERIKQFKRVVIQAATNPAFVHHEWFNKYHLEIVERIALEICPLYPRADKTLVFLLVWFHDYGKIIDADHEHESTHLSGKKKLSEIGFPLGLIRRVVRYTTIFDKKIDIKNAPIEIQIVSSADGAAHLIGPFFAIYWKEQSNRACEDLLKENKRKAHLDWNKKIVLPEVKKAFQSRYKLTLEHFGKFPKKYLSHA